MPNLFSKIASQNGKIKLFSGGKQIESLVPLLDAVRCFKFMEENSRLNREVYNLSKDNVNVKQVAEICKKINKKVLVECTEDEIPNLGYTLSNKKLLNTGFKFLYDLENIFQIINSGHTKKIIMEWTMRSSTIGRNISMTTNEGKITGNAIKLDNDGALIISSGQKNKRLLVGDVTHKN